MTLTFNTRRAHSAHHYPYASHWSVDNGARLSIRFAFRDGNIIGRSLFRWLLQRAHLAVTISDGRPL